MQPLYPFAVASALIAIAAGAAHAAIDTAHQTADAGLEYAEEESAAALACLEETASSVPTDPRAPPNVMATRPPLKETVKEAVQSLPGDCATDNADPAASTVASAAREAGQCAQALLRQAGEPVAVADPGRVCETVPTTIAL